MARQQQQGRWKLTGRLVTVALIVVLGLGAGGPLVAGPRGGDLEFPGQIYDGGMSEKDRVDAAASRRLDRAAPVELAIDLEPYLGRLPQKSEKPFGAPLIIGTHRELPEGYRGEMGARDLLWETARDGGAVAVFSVSSPGAKALRLAVDFHRLPRGAEVRFYSPAAPERAQGPFEAEFLAEMEKTSLEEGPFWSPAISGDALAVAIWVPSWDRADDVRLSLRKISHIHYSIEGKDLAQLGNSGSCNKDIECFNKWTTVADAVAKMVYAVPGGQALCTGQLMANPDGKLLFLTAAHCINTRQQAKSITFFWFFQRDGCNGADPTSVTQTSGGGKMKFTSYKASTGELRTDHTLIQLKRNPPNGVAMMGWKIVDELADNIGEKVHGIHHPAGDVKMGSRGKVRSLEVVEPGGDRAHYMVVWQKGTTEGGSSGSAILCGKRWPKQYLIGVLTGGFASCSARKDPDFYGSFQRTFEQFSKFRKFFQ